MEMCKELLISRQIDMSDKIKLNKDPIVVQDILNSMSQNIYTVTDKIFTQNKQKINTTSQALNYKIEFNTIMNDVNGTTSGAQPSTNQSIKYDSYATTKKGIFNLTNENILQSVEPLRQSKQENQPSQSIIKDVQQIQNITQQTKQQAQQQLILLQQEKQNQQISQNGKQIQ